MLNLLDILIKAYVVVLLFRLILTQQELNFNFVGRGVAKLTNPIFNFAKVPKNQTDRFVPLLVLVLFTLYGLILGMSAAAPTFHGGVFLAYHKMFGFLATFFIICIFLGSMASPSTGTFPLFFYRLGNLIVKPVQKFTRINSNFVIVPAIVALLIAYVLVNTLCYGIEFLIQGDGVHIAGLLFLTVNDIFQIVIRLLEFLMLTIIVRALLSWFSPDPRNMFVQLIYYITEPVLSPFRRIIPPIGMIDVSALVVILGLGLVIKLVTWGSGAIMGALARSLLGG